MMLDSFNNDLIAVIIYSLIKKALISIKLKEKNYKLYDELIYSIAQYCSYRTIDVSWVNEKALFLVGKQIILFYNIRSIKNSSY